MLIEAYNTEEKYSELGMAILEIVAVTVYMKEIAESC